VESTDFFKTAKLLKTHIEEAHLRTSIGRSYYAAFLYFREYLKSLGLEKKKNPNRDVHIFVIQCLQYSNVPEGNKASTYLHDLQQLREDADYCLNRPFSKNDADDAFAKANKAIADYTRNITPEQETKLIQKASDFAKLKDWI
jgi:uncharacterized protein (UPF0332 family)